MKLQPVERDSKTIGYYYECPGCKIGHALYTCDRFSSPTGSRWEFNGDMEKPTFRPSVLSTFNRTHGLTALKCHHYITAGKISYLSDCSHELAGQTVDMTDFEP